MSEKEEGEKGKSEETNKTDSKRTHKWNDHLQETVIDAKSVADVRKGIVSGSSVQQFRSQIDQAHAQQTQQAQQPQQTQPKEKKENQQ